MQKLRSLAPIALFCLIAFGLSWSTVLIGHFRGLADNPAHQTIGSFLFILGPTVAAIICAFIFNRANIVACLAIKPRFNAYIVFAWIAAILICLIAVSISLLAPGISMQSIFAHFPTLETTPDVLSYPQLLDIVMLGQALFLGALINTLFFLGGEIGWRGFLWHYLRPLGFWKSALITGLIWGIWSVPEIYRGLHYPTTPILGMGYMVIFCILLSPLLSYIRQKNGSIWATALFYGTLISLARIIKLVLTHTSGQTPTLWNGVFGLGGAIALLLASLYVLIALKNDKNHRTP